jgi:hypothetical protein
MQIPDISPELAKHAVSAAGTSPFKRLSSDI